MTIIAGNHSISFFLTLFLVCVGSKSRSQHSANDLLKSRTWDIIGTLDFSLGAKDEVYPVFSKELNRYANQEFELRGYLIPIREGIKQTRFLLSTLPVNQCSFCGKNGVPVMVLVEMSEGVKFTFNPVRIKGKLRLKKVNIRDYPPIVLSGAVLLN
jgi:hypothetical protein